MHMQTTHPISGISLEDLRRRPSTSAAVMRLAPNRAIQTRTAMAREMAVDEQHITMLQQALRITLTLGLLLAMSTLFATQVYFTLR
jgi:hypothetical protein